jgi:hypothetical protein
MSAIDAETQRRRGAEIGGRRPETRKKPENRCEEASCATTPAADSNGMARFSGACPFLYENGRRFGGLIDRINRINEIGIVG